MIQIPTATDTQILSLLAGRPVDLTHKKCDDCGRFASRVDLRISSYCNSCRVKHLTAGTPHWKIRVVIV